MYDSDPAGSPAEPRGDDAARHAAPIPHPFANASLADHGRRNYDAAVKLATKHGLAVFPVHGIDGNGKCTCGKDCPPKETGKHPATTHGWKDASSDPAAVAELWAAAVKRFGAKPFNVGVATGPASDVVVIDEDGPAGRASLSALQRDHGTLPKTWTAKTGRVDGGRHVWFRLPEGVTVANSASKVAPGIDIRGDGGYVVVPPSRHWSGLYTWDVSPDDAPLADPPAWLVAMIAQETATKPKAKAEPATPIAAPRDHEASPRGTLTIGRAKSIEDRARLYLDKVPPAVSGDGGQNHTFGTVCRLVELFGELSDDDLLDAMADWNATCVPPWTEKELAHKLADARERVGDGPAIDDVVEPATGPSDDWPTLEADAYHGLAGEFVRAVEPNTEADPAALLVTFLVTFGNAVGRSPRYTVGGDRHHANLYACLVGSSSRARKGSSAGCVRAAYRDIETGQTLSGLSTGEGLIHAVRDGDVAESGGTFTIGPGVAEKRCLVTESEFARLLAAMGRKDNTLSAILRDAWDRGTLRLVTRNNPLTATDAHVSIVAHITRDELAKSLHQTDAVNGFGNRFLWASVRRSKLLPDAGALPSLDGLRDRLAAIVGHASAIGEMRRSAAAAELWRKVYAELVSEKTGLWDAVTSRAEAQTLRLSMIYALLDGSDVIDEPHLRAALAVWRYCDDSARLVFGGGPAAGATHRNGPAGRVRAAVMAQPGILRRDLHRAADRDATADAFGRLLNPMLASGEIVCVPVAGTTGRPTESYYPGVVSVPSVVSGQSETADAEEGSVRCVRSVRASEGGQPESEPGSVRCVRSVRLPETDPMAGVADDLASATAEPAVEPASLPALLDWRNGNGASFFKRDDGVVWVTPETGLTPALRSAVMAHQSTLAAFAPAVVTKASPSTPKSDDAKWAEFEAELRSLNVAG